MTRAAPELITFRMDDMADVHVAMAELASGKGWLKLQPEPDEEEAGDVPPEPGIFRVFSGRGPIVPVCTWVPGERRRGVEYVALGIEHATGPKVADRLRDRGVAVPDEWSILQDHSKRGLVVAVPTEADHRMVLDWLLRAGRALSVVPLTGRWQALVFRA